MDRARLALACIHSRKALERTADLSATGTPEMEGPSYARRGERAQPASSFFQRSQAFSMALRSGTGASLASPERRKPWPAPG